MADVTCVFSTFMTEETRRAMGEQSTQLALAVGYDSAGGNHTGHSKHSPC